MKVAEVLYNKSLGKKEEKKGTEEVHAIVIRPTQPLKKKRCC
jgi:hypothetical protein